jgi:hypothetical protein
MTSSKPRKKFDGSFALSLTLLIALGTTLGVTARGFVPKVVTVMAVTKPATIVAAPVIKPVQAVVSSAPTQAIQKRVVRFVRRYIQAPIATTRAS